MFKVHVNFWLKVCCYLVHYISWERFQVQTWPCRTKQVGNNKLFFKTWITMQHNSMQTHARYKKTSQKGHSNQAWWEIYLQHLVVATHFPKWGEIWKFIFEKKWKLSPNIWNNVAIWKKLAQKKHPICKPYM